MDLVAAEMRAVLEGDANYLAHIGVKYRSGRYPYGSGENPYQHDLDFLGRINKLKNSGWEETPENIMKEFGMTTTEFRKERKIAVANVRLYNIETAKRLAEKEGLGATEIGRRMDVSESTVRGWLSEESENKAKSIQSTADFIKKQIDERGMLDVGAGVNLELNISEEKLNAALKLLQEQGYPVYGGRIPQVTNPSQLTTTKVICPPGTQHKEIYNFENVHSLNEYISRDGGETYEKKFTYPESMDSKRLKIRYAEEGGIDQDGLVLLRRGVDDLSLGNSMYSQVRILVDGTHYIKGMAVYGDDKDFPPGVDVIFNTNKKQGTPVTKVLKEIKDDKTNPFGSAIKDAEQGGQYWYTDKDGKKKLGLINKRADQDDWTNWKDTLPAQFLSKQSYALAKKQLDLSVANKQGELEEIMSITNPTVKKYYLNKFAEECDSAAVHLKAAALPGQKYHVILPVPSLKDTEIYAPGYAPGTQLALVRFPHGGTFEIPIVTVNNKNADAKKMIGTDSIDAVCINSKVAARLSGADFDGDTVMAIPLSSKVNIISKPALKELENFDPKASYPEREGMQYMTKKNTQREMGMVSNLITDMTIKGAPDSDLAKAVKHSMVVIDAYKHKLDYKKSEVENDIATLKNMYQDGGGASTLISKAKSDYSVTKRQGDPHINLKGSKYYDPSRPEGALIYKEADDATYSYYKTNKRTGEKILVTRTRTQKSTQMEETDDARTLISSKNTPMERVYASYANNMKALANTARKAMVTTPKLEYKPEARKEYSSEVSSILSKLNTALINAPREREAQRRANVEVQSQKSSDPGMTREEEKKVAQKAISKAREDVSSVRRSNRAIAITDKEWEAIQAGAISENRLMQILNNSDADSLRQRATPKPSNTLSKTRVNMIKSYYNSGYTLGEIAEKLGISSSQVYYYVKGD